MSLYQHTEVWTKSPNFADDIFNDRQTSNISLTKSKNLNFSRLAVVFAQSVEARC